MRRLIEYGADPLFVHHGVYYGGSPGGNMSQRQEEITTTLMGAVQMGTGRAWTVLEPDEAMVLEMVKLLVEAGVDVNAVGTLPPPRARRGPLPRGTQVGQAAPIPSVGLRTALEGAKALAYDSVVEYLVGKGATGD